MTPDKKVLMNDFKAEPEDLIQDQLKAIERVLRSGWYILGNEVEQFEKEWSSYCSVQACAGVGNGMDAIELGLRAANIGTDDEVITTPMTAFATVLAILRAGAKPVLADIEPDTAHLSMKSVERLITPKTRAVLFVHLYGRIGNMESWSEFANKKGFYLIEDCAQSHGAKHNGKMAGTFGLFGAYSFYPTKNLGAIGDAGAIISKDQELIDTCKSLRNYGQSERYHHPYIGSNSRLDELQAAILRERLHKLDRNTKHRRTIYNLYVHGINNPLVNFMLAPADTEMHVHHLVVIRSKFRDKLQAHLKNKNIETLIHYPIPIHKQTSCKSIIIDPHGLNNAMEHASTCLSLPCNHTMTSTDANKVIEAVNSFKI